MPDYPPSATTPRGVTVVQRLVPAFTAPFGFVQLAVCPTGKSWKVQTIWLHNSDQTLTMRVNLQLVPSGWIGLVSDPLLIVFRELLVEPRDHVTIDAVLGVGAGAALWGYQLDDAGGPNLGVTMTVSGEEV